MLIALMSDTFSRLIEVRPTHSLKNKLMIMATMACIIHEKNKGNQNEVFLYVVQRKDEDDEDMMENDDEN